MIRHTPAESEQGEVATTASHCVCDVLRSIVIFGDPEREMAAENNLSAAQTGAMSRWKMDVPPLRG